MELLICANVFKPNLVTKSFYANPQGCLKGRYFVLTLWGSSTSLKTTVRFLSVYLWITGHRFQPFALPGFIDSLKYHENEKEITQSYPSDRDHRRIGFMHRWQQNVKRWMSREPGICWIRQPLTLIAEPRYLRLPFGNLFVYIFRCRLS